ncbi:VILL family protein [Megaselia abdita]
MINWKHYQEEAKNCISEVKVDCTFRKVPKNAICFHIWRVDDDKIEAVCKASYGTFYDDSAYIIYASNPSGFSVNSETITREVKTAANFERYIHFWIGERASSKKSGNVAFKVMELDSFLGNMTTQFRESQDNESPRFMSYFKNGLTILSGLHKEPFTPCRLFNLKGRNTLRVTEMPSIDWEHFCSDFVMVLKTEQHLFYWIGRSSHVSERRLGLEMMQSFQEIYKVNDIVVVDDGYEQAMTDAQKVDWNKFLPLRDRLVSQHIHSERPPSNGFKLYKCGYKGGKYRIEEIKSSQPVQEDLVDSEAAYIIDGFALGVWIWVGRLVNSTEKSESMRNARGFVKKKKYPSSTALVRVMDGIEPAEFIRLFPSWRRPTDPPPSKSLGKIEAVVLAQRPKMAAETQLIDDGTGERKIYKFTESIQASEIPTTGSVKFSSDSSYVMHYTVLLSGKNTTLDLVGARYIVYIWNGRKSLNSVRSKTNSFGIEMSKKLGNRTVLVKLEEGYESPHFLQIFKGKFLIFEQESFTLKAKPSDFVLRVTGDSSYNAKAMQVSPLTELKSGNCYVLNSSKNWVWCGQGSTGDTREIAKNVANLFGEYNLALESKEPPQFWDSITNVFNPENNNYTSVNGNGYLVENGESFDSDKNKMRMFLVQNQKDMVAFHEFLVIEQADLHPENLYIIDVGDMVYVWIGKQSNVQEDGCWVIAKRYMRDAIIPINENKAVSLVKQAEEPNTFMGLFDTWNLKHWNDKMTYSNLRKYIVTKTEVEADPLHILDQDSDFDKHPKFSISVLQSEADMLPEEVNPIRKEVHLTNDDFISIFSMTYKEFEALPPWKQQELKKKNKLF